ncbi:histidine phosphatase family protein [candidate division KSB1 bacterium]|nr:histidine phosphatase family protein [candidate division KSB1 bacterium]
MKIHLCKVFLVTAILLFSTVTTSAQPTIYLVRHAEKLANWPEDDDLDAYQPLSVEGIARAQKLAEQFKPGTIAAVFSSRTTRSLHTALPLAQKLKLTLEVAEACADTAVIGAFYQTLAQRFAPDKAVVLVTHSNIIPYLLIKAGLAPACHQKMGIVASSSDSWLLIEGYEYFWQVKKWRTDAKTCEGFSRMKY